MKTIVPKVTDAANISQSAVFFLHMLPGEKL